MPLSLTERAAGKIKSVFREHDMPETACLRVGIKGGGCAGFSYTLDVTDAPDEYDEKFTSHEVSLVCDPKSYLYLNGTEIDYNDELLGGGFVFHNPNAKDSCGCGSSFST